MQTLIIMTTILVLAALSPLHAPWRYAPRWCERSDGACQSNRATFADPRPSSGRQFATSAAQSANESRRCFASERDAHVNSRGRHGRAVSGRTS
jgi:hypothetical protein